MKIKSQNGEHIFVEKIFQKIGVNNKTFVEIGAWPKENNSCSLALQYGFDGLFIDPCFNNSSNIYDNQKIKFLNDFVTKDNINQLIGSRFEGEIDFLSIDVDGVDLHLLDSVSVIQPRVICIEYNASLGPDISLTVPYRPDFDRGKAPNTWFCNGSLKATIRIANKLGYDYIGQVFGLNAFFVHKSIGVKPADIATTWQPHQARIKTSSEKDQFNQIINLDWINVNEKGLIFDN